jgi:hypothetical protein
MSPLFYASLHFRRLTALPIVTAPSMGHGTANAAQHLTFFMVLAAHHRTSAHFTTL